jgi:hypothetical protein
MNCLAWLEVRYEETVAQPGKKRRDDAFGVSSSNSLGNPSGVELFSERL